MARKPQSADGLVGTVAELLEPAAAQLFRRQGYARSSTRELAAILGVQSGSLYHYMDGKEDLLFRICKSALTHIDESVRSAIATVPAEEQLRTAIKCHLVTALRDRDSHSTMLTEMRALSAKRRAEIVKRRDKYENFLTSLIDADQQSGRVRSDVSARYLTLALLNMLNWSIFWFDPDGPLDADSWADVLITVFLDGASATPAPLRPGRLRRTQQIGSRNTTDR